LWLHLFDVVWKLYRDFEKETILECVSLIKLRRWFFIAEWYKLKRSECTRGTESYILVKYKKTGLNLGAGMKFILASVRSQRLLRRRIRSALLVPVL
jgi:hypothetical protein